MFVVGRVRQRAMKMLKWNTCGVSLRAGTGEEMARGLLSRRTNPAWGAVKIGPGSSQWNTAPGREAPGVGTNCWDRGGRVISRDALASPPACSCSCCRKLLARVLCKVKAAKLRGAVRRHPPLARSGRARTWSRSPKPPCTAPWGLLWAPSAAPLGCGSCLLSLC